jgi:amidase
MTDSVFGVTRNPWDLNHTPGGSSGGAAAAVASGMVPVAHGNDGMGSIRIPAACCGVFGIKPGTGLVPVDLGPSDWRGLAQNGPIATTVDDAALLLSVMADRPDLATLSTPPRLRVAISTKSPSVGVRVDRQVKAAVVETGRLLEAAGHRVESADPPYATKHGLAAVLRWTAGVHDDGEPLGLGNLEGRNRRHAAIGSLVKRRNLAGIEGRERWRGALAPFFSKFDIVVTPTLAAPPVVAEGWGRKSWLANIVACARYAPFPALWNLADYPAAAVPAGIHSTGLPLSVQVVAPVGQEALVLSVARQLEELRPWPRHAPGTLPV